MSIVTGVKITDEQRNFLNEKSINFSKFVRSCITKEMSGKQNLVVDGYL